LNKKKVYPNYFLIIPMLVFTIFFLVPSTIGYLYAFTDWNPYVDKISFVGLNNLIEVFMNNKLLLAFVNTIVITAVKCIVVTMLGLAISMILKRNFKTGKGLRTVYFAPTIFSALVVGLIFSGLFDANNGIINKTLTSLGLDNLALQWLGKRWPALFTLSLAEVWRSTGYGVVITLAAIQAIPSDYLEASMVDGFSGWQRFRHIILPLIMPAVNVNILFSLIYGLKMFDLVMVLTGGGPGHDTETFGTLILSEMSRDRYAQSVAINLVFSALLVIVAIAYQKFSKKLEGEL
jgi:raffinose/stachyose/melibiose transport system permease protein